MTIKSNRPHLSELETGWDKFWKDFWGGPKPCILIIFVLQEESHHN
jgi:hypothetical protein